MCEVQHYHSAFLLCVVKSIENIPSANNNLEHTKRRDKAWSEKVENWSDKVVDQDMVGKWKTREE